MWSSRHTSRSENGRSSGNPSGGLQSRFPSLSCAWLFCVTRVCVPHVCVCVYSCGPRKLLDSFLFVSCFFWHTILAMISSGVSCVWVWDHTFLFRKINFQWVLCFLKWKQFSFSLWFDFFPQLFLFIHSHCVLPLCSCSVFFFWMLFVSPSAWLYIQILTSKHYNKPAVTLHPPPLRLRRRRHHHRHCWVLSREQFLIVLIRRYHSCVRCCRPRIMWINHHRLSHEMFVSLYLGEGSFAVVVAVTLRLCCFVRFNVWPMCACLSFYLSLLDLWCVCVHVIGSLIYDSWFQRVACHSCDFRSLLFHTITAWIKQSITPTTHYVFIIFINIVIVSDRLKR